MPSTAIAVGRFVLLAVMSTLTYQYFSLAWFSTSPGCCYKQLQKQSSINYNGKDFLLFL